MPDSQRCKSCCLAHDRPEVQADSTFLPGVKGIPLTQGQVALVDAEDYDALNAYLWCATRHPRARTFYAVRNRSESGVNRQIKMHAEILNPPAGMQIDHRDHNGLNNTRANLRLATPSQQLANRRSFRGVSRFKGLQRRGTRWIVVITTEKQRRYVGTFATEEEAARAYDVAATEAFGEFAYLNFPEEVEA